MQHYRLISQSMPRALLIAVAIALTSCAAFAQDASRTVEPARRAAVEVLVDDHLGGSGAFVSREGLVITAAHVIGRPGRRVEIRTRAGGSGDKNDGAPSDEVVRMGASVVAVDLGHDLALLRVEPREGGYAFLEVADDVPAVGEKVFVYGTPMFRHDILLRGHVARRDIGHEWMGGEQRYFGCFYVSGAAPQGMSGGTWLDARGRIVGVQSGIMTLERIHVGIAFVVPVTAVKQLIASGVNAATPTLGAAFEEVWEQGGDYLRRFPPGTEGLVARVLVEKGPIAAAGVEQWQLIRAIDGKPVATRDAFIAAVRTHKPGDKVKLTVMKPDNGGTRDVEVALGSLEAKWVEPGK